MEQTIRFCAAPDGTRIAYATAGSGYPLVVCPGWLGHVELEWANDALRGFWEKLAARYRVIRYDRRGTGLSDRSAEDFSLEAQTADLEAVVDAAGEKHVAVLGYSAGGPIVISYAAAHPDVVSHLILYGTYASGSYVAMSDLAAALHKLIEADWGGMGSLAMADIYIPGAPTEARQAFAEYQKQCATKEVALEQAQTVTDHTVKHLLKEIEMPSLVLHKRGDKAVPFELGRRLARDLPNSSFVPVDGNSHLIGIGRGTTEMVEAILDFLAAAGSASEALAADSITRREAEVLRLLAAGRSNRQIADELSISVNTVDRHVSNVYTKIGATNRAEAASYAIRSGIAS